MKGGSLAMLALAALSAAAAQSAVGQVVTPPKPIPAPPIPASPRLGPAPRITLGAPVHPPRPVLSTIPAAPNLPPIAIPAAAEMTPANPSDRRPPPLSGTQTGPTAMVSPGANSGQIDEVGFALDPGASELPPGADATLAKVAKVLAGNPAARLEVRVFTPSEQASTQGAARRLSLARYLSIRDYLDRAGVAETRVDGRPLVADPHELNPDRAELYIER
jgi:outer membrane protein OmpA-like peptidoglycan-associated protein